MPRAAVSELGVALILLLSLVAVLGLANLVFSVVTREAASQEACIRPTPCTPTRNYDNITFSFASGPFIFASADMVNTAAPGANQLLFRITARYNPGVPAHTFLIYLLTAGVADGAPAGASIPANTNNYSFVYPIQGTDLPCFRGLRIDAFYVDATGLRITDVGNTGILRTCCDCYYCTGSEWSPCNIPSGGTGGTQQRTVIPETGTEATCTTREESQAC